MNWYFTAAGVFAFVVGLVHSVLGERLVFCRMRTTGFIPTNGGTVLREHHVRILWATWHVVTVVGWCIAALLVWLALPSSTQAVRSVIVPMVVASMVASSLLVFVGTTGKHPGWAGLLAVAALAAIGLYT